MSGRRPWPKWEDPFRCDPKSEMMTVHKCYESYLNVNAAKCKDDVCFNCRHGKKLRQKMAE